MESIDPAAAEGQPDRMAPRTAADLMNPRPPVVFPTARVGNVARLLLDLHLSGVPVVRESGEVLGVVTQADLVTRHAHVHFPVFLNILGAAIPLNPLGGEQQFEEDVRRVVGRTAAEIMTDDIDHFAVREDTPLDDVATKMARDGVDPVVVLRGDRLAGVITRADLVRLVIVEESQATDAAASREP